MATRRTGNTKTTTVAKAAVVEVLSPIEEQELSLTNNLAKGIIEWATGLVGFFREAIALEHQAKNALAEAKALKAPTTVEEDQALQLRIKAASAGKKNHVSKWGITAQVHQLHGRLVAVRKRGETAWDETIDITNNLHQEWRTAQEREASRLQELERQAADARALEDRNRELEQLENEALEAEEKSADLSARELCYVESIIAGMTPVKAAKAAGYKHPEDIAAKLELSTKILAAIRGKREAAAIRQQAAAVQQAPLERGHVPEVKPAVSYVAGAGDRTRASAKLVDATALIAAVLAGKHGIPLTVLSINEVELNRLARELGSVISKWPGVEYVEKTRLQ